MFKVPQLNWPSNLFYHPLDFLVEAHDRNAPLFVSKTTAEHLCACRCGFPHNHAISRVLGDSGARRVVWYRSQSCRNKHAGLVVK